VKTGPDVANGLFTGIPKEIIRCVGLCPQDSGRCPSGVSCHGGKT
jgi:hypothetical protein